jgi:N-formylglutamate amidohydrolase
MTVASPSDMPSFERLGPGNAVTPLVCAVPHAGRHYPPALLARSAVPTSMLEQLEDRHADLLIQKAVECGAVAVVARIARAWIDLNRGEDDLDPALRDPPGSGGPLSARARSGLGLLPHRIGRRELWREPPSAGSAAGRIAAVHRPYHQAIAQALDAARARFGYAVLIDCHSMPTLGGIRPAQVVVGDGHGRFAGKGVAAHVAKAARNLGYMAALNAPYAGAYGVARHGRPESSVHALQIEFDRALYLERDMRTPSAGVERAQRLMVALATAAVTAVQPAVAIAAE